MEPLSRRTRSVYLILLIVLFIIVMPVAILYASGYRLADLSLTPTGGVFVIAPLSDALVSINGEEVGTTGLFTKSYYIDDLAPGTYVVQASREGYYPWAKTLIVEESLVTDVSAFLVPVDLPVLEILVGTTTATTTKNVEKEERDALLEAFVEATTTPELIFEEEELLATSSLPVDVRGGQGLFIEEGDLVLRWLRNASSTPSSFCETPSLCVTEFKVEYGKEIVTEAVFFETGTLYGTEGGSVYFAETDVRPSPLTVKIYSGKGAEFRVISGAVYVKEGKSLFEIGGL